MEFTPEQAKTQVDLEVSRSGKSRKEVIEDKMNGARKGAFRAEKAVATAQDALQAGGGDREAQEQTIAREGRFASLEHARIAVLRTMLQEEVSQP